MRSDDMPTWLRFRPPRETPEDRVPSKLPAATFLLIFGVLVALCVYVAFNHPSAFHIVVMAAGTILFGLMLLSRVQYSRIVGGAFVLGAVAVNCVMAYAVTVIGDPASGVIAYFASVIVTGFIGLLLLTRTSKILPVRVKAAVIGSLVAMSAPGPLIYMFAPGAWTSGSVTDWLILTSPPILVVLMAASFVMSAHHRSEVTVPSDKWV